MIYQDSAMERPQEQKLSVAQLLGLVIRLRQALEGVAERHIEGDSLPCFCVEYQPSTPEHSEWCSEARASIAEAMRITAAADDR
ncbi:MAG: hypothetical protein IT306_23665 [Chloroflexi bacterium]|nr:hypothetical protein [Chloroflexota bacterium]